MKETIDFHKAKEIMSNINIIIYGTIRNIEEDFIQSFTNLDILACFFKKTHITYNLKTLTQSQMIKFLQFYLKFYFSYNY